MTTIAKALAIWEKDNGAVAEEAEDIGLQFQMPPIAEMDGNLSKLTKCKKLSLSTNIIEKITGLQGMKNLVILSLSRNNISSLTGLDAVGETLEQLWISYNNISHLGGLEKLPKLKILYITHNLIRKWEEVDRIGAHKNLKELTFKGNPLVENLEDDYHEKMITHLPKIKRLDGTFIVRN